MKELQNILEQAHSYFNKNMRCVLATIVKIEGSGYRRQGTRMLISEAGKFTGAISGGCVEKEVWAQSASVFITGLSKVITYDGRYRLGCEGTLYILIEPVAIAKHKLDSFTSIYENRKPLRLTSLFTFKNDNSSLGHTYFEANGHHIFLTEDTEMNGNYTEYDDVDRFEQFLKPVRSLFIFGSEHDAVAVSKMASDVGWDVSIIAHPLNEKSISHFKGAKYLKHLLPEELDELTFDAQTACLLMSHSYSRDFAYLLALSNFQIPYIGLLGPQKRKNQILNELIERKPEISDDFLDAIYGPTGLDIGAETPYEIAVSILAELQSVFTNTLVDHLKNKSGSIHAR